MMLILLIVVVAGTVSFVQSRTIDTTIEHRFTDSKQASFVQQLESYDVIVPTAVDESGQFLSHDLQNGHRRFRRYTDDSDRVSNYLYFKLRIGDTDLHLKVSRNDKFISPGYVFETRGNSSDVRNHKIVQKKGEHHQCHYLGGITSQPFSHVAISNCAGLRGYIHADGGQYLIEPIFGHDVISDPRHPHIVYKRPVAQGPMDQERQESAQAQELYQQIQDGLSDKSTAGIRHSGTRQKRSTSLKRNVEVLVVADPLMVDYYHDRGDIQLYILTVMNMVTGMYTDASIGNDVNIVLVRVMLLSEDQEELHIKHNARPTLDSFSSWQESINMESDEHPNHHDVAVLITRVDICSGSNRPCHTLGLSNIAAMCDPLKSTNINDDTGLNVAFTIAHELGHNLGMKHDGDDNECKTSPKNAIYIMNGTMSSSVASLVWSPCSREYITLFLDRGWGDCLLDEPSEHEFDYPDVPPGVMYDANHQCRLRYGPTVSVCFPDDICRSLWCFSNQCHTKMGGAAPGTPCGKSKWCFNGRCVDMTQRAVTIDGNWGTWSGWSTCSRTCGRGVSTMRRECNNPRPAHGGRYCIGKREKYALCNTEPCSPQSQDFREKQCSEFNNKLFRRSYYQWEPYHMQGKECELVCKPKYLRRYEILKIKVIDGTSCNPENAGICISGICQKVGCDNKIESKAVEDQCGVCHGDGSSCETIKSNITQYGVGYKEVVVIPVGARNIMVYEVGASVNYLALRGPNGDYILNGNWYITSEGYYPAAGTTVIYERQNNLEKFKATGPLTEPLTIEVLMQQPNADLSVQYTIPKNNTDITERLLAIFEWEHSDWTHCSATCGGGEQMSFVTCVNNIAGLVDGIYCNQTTRPDHRQRVCNTKQCPATWWTGNWQPCSTTCGSDGSRTRSVFCIRSFGYDEQMAIADEKCILLGAQKPIGIVSCNRDVPCPVRPVWRTGDWDECSSTCGDGTQHREVVCSVAVHMCDVTEQPTNQQSCTNKNICAVAPHIVGTNAPEEDEVEDFLNGEQYDIPITFGEWERLQRQSPARQQEHLKKLIIRNKKNPDRREDEEIELAIDKDAVMGPIDSDKAMERHLVASRKEEIEKMFEIVQGDDIGEFRSLEEIRVEWRVGGWRECSVSCGEGTEARMVECVDIATNETNIHCPIKDKPTSTRSCSPPPCPVVSRGSNECTRDSMSSAMCKSMKSRGNCQYLQYRKQCCLTCGQ